MESDSSERKELWLICFKITILRSFDHHPGPTRETLSVILFELELSQLPNSKEHRGPPVYRTTESSSFLSKHLGEMDTVSGPWIEDGSMVRSEN